MKRLYCYSALFAVFILRSSPVFGDVVNPHWTGKHCNECHVQDNSTELLYSGDINALCNRCHLLPGVTQDQHPVDITPARSMLDRKPDTFPLQDGRLSCRTCHDIIPQMYASPASRQVNPDFIRGAPYDNLAVFCFSCHVRESFAKVNPHIQIDTRGTVMTNRCLYCHQSVPDTETASGIDSVSFTTQRTALCVSCHNDKRIDHPARADHSGSMNDDMRSQYTRAVRETGVDLPLFDNAVFCGTCHNPHDEGVIRRKEASYGSGKKYFLRLDGGFDLCVMCHASMKRSATVSPVKMSKDFLKKPPSLLMAHKPWQEKKCKACHSVSSGVLKKPVGVLLCLKDGCHTTEVIDGRFKHERSVLNNCYFCHESHSAHYNKLLRTNDTRLCYTCHQLLTGMQPDRSIVSEKMHDTFLSYVFSSELPPGSECFYCHSPLHKQELPVLATGLCADCHIKVRTIVYENTEIKFNVHQKFDPDACTTCHNAHSSMHEHMLLKDKTEYDSYVLQ